MTKLKLGPIADDKPVKVTVELPASVHRDLIAYAEILGHESGQASADPVRLIVPICESEEVKSIAVMIVALVDRDNVRARLSNRRQAGLSFRGDHTAQKGNISFAIGR
jgi:hypothetical protein